ESGHMGNGHSDRTAYQPGQCLEDGSHPSAIEDVATACYDPLTPLSLFASSPKKPLWYTGRSGGAIAVWPRRLDDSLVR
ncbi:MAG: hypothetical protein N2C12_09710, partial [Planctomycetales bacterium]